MPVIWAYFAWKRSRETREYCRADLTSIGMMLCPWSRVAWIFNSDFTKSRDLKGDFFTKSRELGVDFFTKTRDLRGVFFTKSRNIGKTKVTDPLQFQAVQLSDCRPGAAELEMLRDKLEQNKTNPGNSRQYMTIRVGAVEKE